MFCPMCGAPNEDEATYCANCGAALAGDAASQEPLGQPESTEEAEGPVEPLGPMEPEGSVEPEGGAHVFDAYEPVAPDEVEAQPLIPIAAPRPPAPPSPARTPSASSTPVNGMAVASLILGIAGVTVLPLISSIFAIIFGYMARREIRQRPYQTSGDGLAVAGIVLGWIGVGLLVLVLIGGGVALCGLCSAFSSGAY